MQEPSGRAGAAVTRAMRATARRRRRQRADEEKSVSELTRGKGGLELPAEEARRRAPPMLPGGGQPRAATQAGVGQSARTAPSATARPRRLVPTPARQESGRRDAPHAAAAGATARMPSLALATCSDMSQRPVAMRVLQWKKRLVTARSAQELVERYATAVRGCELPDWTAERTFLKLLQERVADEGTAVAVLLAFADRPEVQRYVGQLMLRRVVGRAARGGGGASALRRGGRLGEARRRAARGGGAGQAAGEAARGRGQGARGSERRRTDGAAAGGARSGGRGAGARAQAS